MTPSMNRVRFDCTSGVGYEKPAARRVEGGRCDLAGHSVVGGLWVGDVGFRGFFRFRRWLQHRPGARAGRTVSGRGELSV